MKTIKDKTGELSRVKENEAEIKVKSGNWTYAPKSEWKATIRKQKDSTSKSDGNEGKRSKKSSK